MVAVVCETTICEKSRRAVLVLVDSKQLVFHFNIKIQFIFFTNAAAISRILLIFQEMNHVYYNRFLAQRDEARRLILILIDTSE